jgi:hypothetical protein
MFERAAEEKEKAYYRNLQKKRQSVEHLMFLRRTLYCLFTDESFLGRYLEQFEIENKKIMADLEKSQLMLLDRYLKDGLFDRIKFDADLDGLLKKFSNKYKEDEPTNIVLKILDNNEIVNKELKNPDIVDTLENFEIKKKERNLELAFLTMYLASASDKEHEKIMKAKPNSELLVTIKGQQQYKDLRDAYRNSFIKENKQELTTAINIKKKLAL